MNIHFYFQNFSQLESLEYTISNFCSCQSVLTWPLALKRLKIIFIQDEDLVLVEQSITRLSQLVTLEIYQKERGRLYPNDQIWEELIRSSLSLLKHFKFQHILYTFDRINQIVSFFSTPFYILKKK
jgi:hypothetical protein